MPRTRHLVAVPVALLASFAATLGPSAPAPAVTTVSASSVTPANETSRLGLWNWDLESGGSSSYPEFWSVSPARPTSTEKVVRVPGRAPFSVLGSGNTVNHIVWVWDSSKRGSAVMRSRAFDASPGRRYTVSGAAVLGRGRAATLNVEFYSASGRRLSVAHQSGATPVAGRQTRVTASGVAPAGTDSATLLLASDSANTGSSYWENFAVDEERTLSSYDPRMSRSSAMFVPGFRVAYTSRMAQEIIPGVKHGVTVDSSDASPVYDGYTRGAPAHAAQLSGSVIRDGDVYKMWFTGKINSTTPWSTWYSESPDGITWTTGTEVLNGVVPSSVLRNPDTRNPAKRFLMLGVRGSMQLTPNKPIMPPFDVEYRTYSSPDGKTWNPMSSGPAIPFRDVAVATWDAYNGQFVAMTKQPSGRDRQLFTSTSRDFVHWTTPRQALRTDSADPAKTDVYTTAIFRSGEELVALPSLYTASTLNGVNGPLRLFYASSRDGVHFSRPYLRQPSLPLGRAGSLDDGIITPASQPVDVGENKIRLYYSGWNGGHEDLSRKPRIFYAEWTRERFAALRASGTYGSVTTQPLLPSGKDLTINATVPAGGAITVSVLDARTRKVIPGFEAARSTRVTGDQLAASVQWGSRTFRSLAGRQVVLNFVATHASKLYSFRIS